MLGEDFGILGMKRKFRESALVALCEVGAVEIALKHFCLSKELLGNDVVGFQLLVGTDNVEALVHLVCHALSLGFGSALLVGNGLNLVAELVYLRTEAFNLDVSLAKGGFELSDSGFLLRNLLL